MFLDADVMVRRCEVPSLFANSLHALKHENVDLFVGGNPTGPAPPPGLPGLVFFPLLFFPWHLLNVFLSRSNVGLLPCAFPLLPSLLLSSLHSFECLSVSSRHRPLTYIGLFEYIGHFWISQYRPLLNVFLSRPNVGLLLCVHIRVFFYGFLSQCHGTKTLWKENSIMLITPSLYHNQSVFFLPFHNVMGRSLFGGRH